MDVEADEATFDRADVTRDVTYKDSVAKGKTYSLGAVVWHTCARQIQRLGFALIISNHHVILAQVP